MVEKINELVENNVKLIKIKQNKKEILQLMRMYLNLNMAYISRENERTAQFKFIKAGQNENFDFINYILANKYQIDETSVIISTDLNMVKNMESSEIFNSEDRLIKELSNFIDEIDKYNSCSSVKLKYIDVIDYILNRKVPEFKKEIDESFFEDVKIEDLLYIYVILESDLINLEKYDIEKNIIEISYLNIINKKEKNNYIDILLDYYRTKKNTEKIEIELDDVKKVFNEENDDLRIYKIAAVYKYLIEKEKVDIIKALRNLLEPNNIYKGIKIRSYYFKNRYFKKVEKLPYSEKTKNDIYKIFNYILSYRYNFDIPYVPINILIYCNDKDAVAYVSNIIGSFMHFYGYIQIPNMKYYDEYLNDVILDKFKIKKIYYEKEIPKKGIIILHNFENLSYISSENSNLIMNILTDEMEINNRNSCTIIYGDKVIIKSILEKNNKLSEKLINFELEIEDLDEDTVSEILINKFEKKQELSNTIKDKIKKYVVQTYKSSGLKNLDYINKLYDMIILNSSNKFEINSKNKIKPENIPQVNNFKNLSSVEKELDSLVGLSEIKNQIKDLMYLLKFNKNANINLEKLNLHMVFTGNPGTGKTTVGRLITEMLYDLGYINKNKLTEVTSRDLIAQYIGQTQEKTYNVVKSALGGVLFIDEAYSLSQISEFGEESIATLIKMMEDYKDKLVIIFAGYENEMENFIKANAGLKSRIGYKIKFSDYTVEELMQIYMDLLKKNNLKITNSAKEKLKNIIVDEVKIENFGNARYIINIFQKILIEHAKNIENENIDEMYKITDIDINDKILKHDNKNKRIGF